jgi:hypothetical protein
VQPAHAHHLSHTLPGPKHELASLIDVLPASLGLVTASAMARQGLELISNAAKGRRFETVLTEAQAELRNARIPVLVERRGAKPDLTPLEALSRSQRRWLGQVALELYFVQLFRSDVAILDLWPSRLGVDEAGDALWAPRPFYVRWDATFQRAVQDVYAGFFLENRHRFDRGVRGLELGDAADALVGHFGDGNQRNVRFGSEVIQLTLTHLAKLRAGDETPLHPNFIAFGLYLLSLHKLLETLDMRFDVRAAFKRSYAGTSQR